jgi:hypothetical protein
MRMVHWNIVSHHEQHALLCCSVASVPVTFDLYSRRVNKESCQHQIESRYILYLTTGHCSYHHKSQRLYKNVFFKGRIRGWTLDFSFITWISNCRHHTTLRIQYYCDLYKYYNSPLSHIVYCVRHIN